MMMIILYLNEVLPELHSFWQCRCKWKGQLSCIFEWAEDIEAGGLPYLLRQHACIVLNR